MRSLAIVQLICSVNVFQTGGDSIRQNTLSRMTFDFRDDKIQNFPELDGHRA